MVVGLLVGAMLSIAGCDQTGGGANPSTVDEEEIQRLEALGYLDYAPDATDHAATEVIPDAGVSRYPGYDLFTVNALHRADLRDDEGRVVRSWRGEGGLWERATLTPEGDVLAVVRMDKRRFLARYAWDGRLLWKQMRNVHHLAAQRPDGKITVLTSQMVKSPLTSRKGRMINNWLVLMTADGEVIEGRSLSEMLTSRPDLFTFRPASLKNPDMLHANYFDWMSSEELASKDSLYALSNVLVTIREQDTIVVFDFSRGELVWSWGQGELLRPHEATVLCNGNFLIFDNRKGEGWSRVVELNPLTREIEWEHHAEPLEAFYSETRGTAQRLPNGNTLIGASNQGRAFEVARDGTVVWQFLGPDTNEKGSRATIRVNRYESDFIQSLRERHARPAPGPEAHPASATLAVGCP